MLMPPSLNTGIQAILFDLDNTLIDRNGALRVYLVQWLKRFAPSVRTGQYPAEIATIMHTDDWGYTDRTAFCAWLKERYQIKLPVEAMLADLLANIPRQLMVNPRLLELLIQLKTDFTIGLLSNGSGKTQRAKMKHAGLEAMFEEKHLFIEGETGYAKPHPKMFTMAIKSLGVAPERILFVGDDPVNDIAGSANAGMKTCWVAQGRAFPKAIVTPDFTIHRIIQLSGLLTYA
jgi:putative hydrolase of the HAD superfamily